MEEVKRYTCDYYKVMKEDKEGLYVRIEDYNELRDYLDEVFDLASSNTVGHANDKLYNIVNKYGDV